MSDTDRIESGLDRDGNIEPFETGLVMGRNGPRAADPWEMPRRSSRTSTWLKTHYECSCGAREVEMSRHGALPSDDDSDIKFRCLSCGKQWWMRNEMPVEPEETSDAN